MSTSSVFSCAAHGTRQGRTWPQAPLGAGESCEVCLAMIVLCWPPSFCDLNNLFHLSGCVFRAERSSQGILDNSADLPKRAKFICLYPWCDDLESPRWKVLRRYGKIVFFKCWGCLEGGGGLCMAMPAWGVQSGFPYGQFLGFLLFQICINGPLKEAKLLKTADNEKGGGERQASSK